MKSRPSHLREVEPVEEYEIGASFLFVFVVFAPVIIVGGIVIGWLMFAGGMK